MTKRAPGIRYESRYSPGKKLRPAHYIAELMCENRSLDLKLDLPTTFHNLPEWKKFFKYQLWLANVLLRDYDHNAIVRAIIKHPRVWSLKNVRLMKEIVLQQDQINEAAREVPRVTSTVTTSTCGLTSPTSYRRSPKVDNIIDRLKQIDQD